MPQGKPIPACDLSLMRGPGSDLAAEYHNDGIRPRFREEAELSHATCDLTVRRGPGMDVINP
jgi:hypothetical protein